MLSIIEKAIKMYIVLHNEYGIFRRSIEEKMDELPSYIKKTIQF